MWGSVSLLVVDVIHMTEIEWDYFSSKNPIYMLFNWFSVNIKSEKWKALSFYTVFIDLHKNQRGFTFFVVFVGWWVAVDFASTWWRHRRQRAREFSEVIWAEKGEFRVYYKIHFIV